MIPRGWGCWTDRVDMDSSLSSAGQTAVDHAILQSTDGIQKGKSQSVYHNHTWLSPWWSSQFCSPSSSTYQWSGKKRGNTQGPYTERVPPPGPPPPDLSPTQRTKGESRHAEAQNRQPQQDRHETLQFRELNCLGGTGLVQRATS